MIKAIIFDMDGVIVNSEEHWKSIDNEFISKKVSVWSHSDEERIVGMSIKNIYQLLVKEYGLQEAESSFLEDYELLADKVYGEICDLEPGIIDLLEYCCNINLSMALCSSSRKSWVDMVLKRFHLEKYFSYVITGDDVNNSKPDPEIYLKVMKDLEINNSEVIAIEDSENGIISALSADCNVLSYKNGIEKENVIRIEDFFELIEKFKKQRIIQFSDLQ